MNEHKNKEMKILLSPRGSSARPCPEPWKWRRPMVRWQEFRLQRKALVSYDGHGILPRKEERESRDKPYAMDTLPVTVHRNTRHP